MNYKLTISYDGTRFAGWQKQPAKPSRETAQGRLEAVAAKLARTCAAGTAAAGGPEGRTGLPQGGSAEPCLPEPAACGAEGAAATAVNGAGRTDAGVHALGQVANVNIPGDMPPEEVRKYFNDYLPESIRIEAATEADERFHARLCCIGKTYAYHVTETEKPDVFRRNYTYFYGKKLDLEKMRAAARRLQGVHDFAGFATKAPNKKSTCRRLESAEITEDGGEIVIRFTGDGFLYNQVRIMTGTLLQIGSGELDADIIEEIFKSGDRQKAGFTAPAKGLFLEKVYY